MILDRFTQATWNVLKYCDALLNSLRENFIWKRIFKILKVKGRKDCQMIELTSQILTHLSCNLSIHHNRGQCDYVIFSVPCFSVVGYIVKRLTEFWETECIKSEIILQHFNHYAHMYLPEIPITFIFSFLGRKQKRATA